MRGQNRERQILIAVKLKDERVIPITGLGASQKLIDYARDDLLETIIIAEADVVPGSEPVILWERQYVQADVIIVPPFLNTGGVHDSKKDQSS